MIKGFYQESIFCREWNKEFMAQIEHKIQLLLAQNNGVGVVGGSYAPGLPITLVSELALNALGYANVEQFQRRTAMLFTNCLSTKDRALQDVETFRRFTGEKILALPTQPPAVPKATFCPASAMISARRLTASWAWHTSPANMPKTPRSCADRSKN